MNFDNNPNKNLIEYCLRLADDRLILGQRLAELCGHAPMLEEDIAITNTSLDLIGQATSIYEYAAELINDGKTADDIVFFRGERHYKNVLLSEQDNTDFAFMIMRQFIFDSFDVLFQRELSKSSDERLASIAAKAYKESLYHFRHAKLWVLRLGDGTTESNAKINDALEYLWMYSGELFEMDAIHLSLVESNIAPNLDLFKSEWLEMVNSILTEATLPTQTLDTFMQTGGRKGRHTEYLGHILAELQYIPRAYPTAQW